MKTEKLFFMSVILLYLASIFFAFQPIGDAYYHVMNSKDIKGYLFPKECNNFTWMWPPLFHIVGFLSGALIGNWYLATRLVSFASLLACCFLLRRRGWLFLLLFIAMPGAWLIGTNSYAESLLLMLIVGSATFKGPLAAASMALASLVKHEALLFLPLFWFFNPSLRLFLISLLGQFAFMGWSALTCNNPLLAYGRTQTLVVNPATISDNLVHGLLAYPMAFGVLLPFALVGIAGYRFGRDRRLDYLVIGSALLVILYEGMTAMGRGTVQGRYLGLLLPAAAVLASGPVERLTKKSGWLLPVLVALLAGQSLYMAVQANLDAAQIARASELVSGTLLTSCPETLVFAEGRYQKAITPEMLTATKVDLEWLKEENVDYVVYCELEWVDNSNIVGVLAGPGEYGFNVTIVPPKLEKLFEAKINKGRGKIGVFRVHNA